MFSVHVDDADYPMGWKPAETAVTIFQQLEGHFGHLGLRVDVAEDAIEARARQEALAATNTGRRAAEA